MHDHGNAGGEPADYRSTYEVVTALEDNKEFKEPRNGLQIAIELDSTLDTTAEMQRFYTLAKRQAWKLEQLSWGKLPPVPEGKTPCRVLCRDRQLSSKHRQKAAAPPL